MQSSYKKYNEDNYFCFIYCVFLSFDITKAFYLNAVNDVIFKVAFS